VIPLHNAVETNTQPMVFGGTRAFPTIDLARQINTHTFRSESRLYVATPALLGYLGIDPASVDPSTDFLADPTVPTDELVIPSMTKTRIPGTREMRIAVVHVTNVQRIHSRDLLGSPKGETNIQPSSFITLNGLRRHGWKQIAGGWLLDSSRPLTSKQIAAARDLAASAGLTIEAQRASTSFAKPIAIATGAGALLALAILAMTVGLIRGESAGDLRTLTATGATSRIRRTLTAATAGALALLGAFLGIAGAYLALAATYLDDLGYLSRIPVLSLVVIVVGVPLIATAAGWLLAGREPRAIARPVIE
jgi:putative ABC transport system permease protein